MKKISVNLIIIIILIFSTSCISKNDEIDLKEGTYIFQQTGTEEVFLPRVTISGDNITFTYDLLSSYLPAGGYTITENSLTMSTSDGLYKYVFLIEGDMLIFQKNESSKIRLTNSSLGINLNDNSKFKLINN